MEKKPRATNNRTLVVADEEMAHLSSQLLTLEQMEQKVSFLDRVIHADMFKALDRLPDGMADLIIVDPPYNISKVFGDSRFNRMNEARYEEYLRSWMHAVCSKLKPEGSLYLCGDWKCSSAMQRVLSEELTILNRITWQREKGRGSKCNWKNGMEDIWFAVRNPRKYCFNVDAVMQRHRVIAPYRQDGQPKDWEETDSGRFRLTHPSNFWNDISVPFWSMPENTDHPTQKPEKLYAKLVLASSKPGDVVFDPFMGSGTACVVAKKLGRHFIGVEQEKQYCLWALKRLQIADTDTTIQGYVDGAFQERNAK